MGAGKPALPAAYGTLELTASFTVYPMVGCRTWAPVEQVAAAASKGVAALALPTAHTYRV